MAHKQATNSVKSHLMSGDPFGKVLRLAVEAINEANDRENYLRTAEDLLAKKIKAACIHKYASPFDLLTMEDKAALFEYMLEYHVDFDQIAQAVLSQLNPEDNPE